MINKDRLPPGWKDNIEGLWSKLKIIRTLFFGGIITLIGLNFIYDFPAWPIVLFMLGVGALTLYVLYNHIKCPYCQAPLLTKKGLTSGDNCYSCGFKLDDNKAIEDTMAAKYPDSRTDKTDWTPLQTAGANFDQYKLKSVKSSRLAFGPTIGSLLFSLLFIAIGVVIAAAMLISGQMPNQWILLFPALFSFIGLYMLFSSFTPIVFDLDEGVFRHGRGRDDVINLMEVDALQLLPKEVSGDNNNYMNYQINLVMTGYRRQNVVYYYHKEKAINDAKILQSNLGVKLWNGIDRET